MNNSSFLEVKVELSNPKAGLKTLGGFELPLDRKLALWGQWAMYRSQPFFPCTAISRFNPQIHTYSHKYHTCSVLRPGSSCVLVVHLLLVNQFFPHLIGTVKSLSRVWLLVTPWTAAYQAPPSMGFFQARVLERGAIAFSIIGTGAMLMVIRITCHLRYQLSTASCFPTQYYTAVLGVEQQMKNTKKKNWFVYFGMISYGILLCSNHTQLLFRITFNITRCVYQNWDCSLTAPCGMLDLSSLTRDQTCTSVSSES